MQPHQLPTPPDVAEHPELCMLATLDSALDMSRVALIAQYPEILPPDWPLASHHPPQPGAYAANLLLALIHALRDAARAYRETIARPPACHCVDHNNRPPF